MESKQKKELVNFFLEKGFLVSPEMLDFEKDYQDAELNQDTLVLSRDALEFTGRKDVDWKGFELSRALFEKGNKSAYVKFIEFLKEKEAGEDKKEENKDVKIVFSYEAESKKRDIQDFVALFNARYKALEKLMQGRRELQGLMSINRIRNKKDRGAVSFIGMIKEKSTTKNMNIILEVEDPSGWIKVLINKNRHDIYNLAKNLVYDEVIGISGMSAENIVFANNIIWPDVPVSKELKKASEEAYAIVLTDLHVGSIKFLPDELNQFIEWINGQLGNEAQREVARKVKYCFIAGDLIDGVGIYPGQEEELEIMDIYKQYEVCAEWLKKIPPRIHLIVCPGNHDAMRIAEPQPVLYRDFAKPIWDLPNVTMISNPGIVNIHSSGGFPGFDVLLYHGYSFDYYVANVDSIRNQGGYDRADLIMQFLLQRRHLAPTHTSTLYLPETSKDPLVIEKIPDFFITGHIHKSSAATYRGITLICGSCWQSKTSFQIKVGHDPEPARVPIINLQTREVKMLKFGK
jgi:DNA polymerase II small subunit